MTNEIVTAEEPGGASTHTKKSSVADGAFENDVDILAEVRRLVDFLPLSNREKPPVRPFFDDVARVEDSLNTLIPDNPNQPYDMKELILKVADEGDFYEIQKDYAANIITGFIRLEGRRWAWWRTSRWCWPAVWISTAAARPRVSCVSATRSKSRS
ncbi:MAG: carboxyl transferase domain-containing protein [Paracoccaceae bacterium]